MPKAVLLDPQGKAVTGALHRLGKEHISEVRIGKRFELTVDEVTPELLEEARVLGEEIFANLVIEDVVSVTTLDESVAGETH